MKVTKTFTSFRSWNSRILLISFVLSAVSCARAELTPRYSTIVPGLDYAHVTETNHPWSIHIARMDRSHKELELTSTLAQGTVVGLSTVVNQLKALPVASGRPLAAVNGDFFVIAKGPYQGDPLGLQVLHGELVSAPSGASFWKDGEGNLFLGNIESKFAVTLPGGEKIPFGLNEERKAKKAVLFTPRFGPSTRTTNGMEMVLERIEGKGWLPLRVDKVYEARISEIRSAGDTPLKADNLVLSIDSGLTNRFAAIRPGTVLRFSTGTSKDISNADIATGGRPLLVVRGKELKAPAPVSTATQASTPTSKEKSPAAPVRHPRTALGWNKQYLFLMEVDGRRKDLSMGMSFEELAHFMKTIGCTDAINLDGGGSSTFWLNGNVVNSPSDKHERTVANSLVILQHQPGSNAQEPLQKASN
jgi:Phosphodiester glycosidase